MRAPARTTVRRLNRLLLIHHTSSVLSTVFLLVPPLSTVTSVALKLRVALVLSLAFVFALLSLQGTLEPDVQKS